MDDSSVKKTIMLYSDCPVYGGSERLINVILNNTIINKKYRVLFAYSNHRVYKEGLLKEHDGKISAFYPLPILPVATFNRILSENQLPKVVRRLAEELLKVIEKAGLIFFYNLIVQTIHLLKTRPDIVHINNGGFPGAESCSTMVFSCSIARINKIVYHVNNFAKENKSAARKIFDKRIDVLVGQFITASKDTRMALSLKRGFSLEKISQVPNAITKEQVTVDRCTLLSHYNMPDYMIVLCQVGFLTERKGQAYLIETMRTIKTKNRKIYDRMVLFLVGNGEMEVELNNLVKKYEMVEKVILTGFRSDSINFINAADIFVHPSVENEDMPLVILTAMSLGKPIISTKLAGIKEQIEDNIGGVLIDPTKETIVEQLHKAIIDMYGNPNKNKMGDNAKKTFEDKFTLEKYGEKLIEIYDKVDRNII